MLTVVLRLSCTTLPPIVCCIAASSVLNADTESFGVASGSAPLAISTCLPIIARHFSSLICHRSRTACKINRLSASLPFQSASIASLLCCPVNRVFDSTPRNISPPDTPQLLHRAQTRRSHLQMRILHRCSRPWMCHDGTKHQHTHRRLKIAQHLVCVLFNVTDWSLWILSNQPAPYGVQCYFGLGFHVFIVPKRLNCSGLNALSI